MKCPYCGHTDSKVVDSRPAEEGASIRRRRECLECGRRFTTYETVERMPIIVIKKDGSREQFDREKVLSAMLRAFEKRSVTLDRLVAAVSNIEQKLQNYLSHEVPSNEIGEKVIDEIKSNDKVAYLRFVSVYRQFKDVDSFLREINQLSEDNK